MANITNRPEDQLTEDLDTLSTAEATHTVPWYETTTADQIKELTERLSSYTDADLKRLPVVKEGSQLQQGAVYYDIVRPQCGDFAAKGDEIVPPGHYYVPKRETDYLLWNRLIGVANPERLDEE